MAGVTIEGTLWIELADVFAWLGARVEIKNHAIPVRVDIENDVMVWKRRNGESQVEVDTAEFWAWVIDSQLPTVLSGYETVFGVPRVDGADLVINFAASNISDPRTMSPPPACLAEWTSQQSATTQG